MLDQIVEFSAAHHVDFALIDATSEAIIAGYRANIIRSNFTLITQKEGEDERAFLVFSRSYAVFAPGRAFTIGLSSSADEDYYDENDFDRIIASVRIGA